MNLILEGEPTIEIICNLEEMRKLISHLLIEDKKYREIKALVTHPERYYNKEVSHE